VPAATDGEAEPKTPAISSAAALDQLRLPSLSLS
jgi:hypothetical protein